MDFRFTVHAIDDAEMTTFRAEPEACSHSYGIARNALAMANSYQYGLVLIDNKMKTADWGDRVTKIGGAA